MLTNVRKNEAKKKKTLKGVSDVLLKYILYFTG